MPMTREEREALVVRYRDGAAAFRAALADVADAELDERPIDGEWTVREIAHHLADSELNSAVRLRRLIAEDEPVLQGYDETTFVRRLHVTERPIGQLDRRRRGRPRLDADRSSRRSPTTSGTRTGTHAEQGPYSVEAWLLDYANHPWDHADQARRVLAALRRELTPRPDLPQNRRRLT